MNDWKSYIYKTKDKNPRPILVEAASLSPGKTVLDIGAGALNESRWLATQGFEVLAIEPCSASQEIPHNGIELLSIPIQSYSFDRTFDLVSALYCLPFLSREYIPLLITKILKSLTPGGIFVFQLFGPEDDWKDTCSTHSKEEVQALLNGFNIVKLEEVRKAAATALQGQKNWHVFHVIARKPFPR